MKFSAILTIVIGVVLTFQYVLFSQNVIYYGTDMLIATSFVGPSLYLYCIL